MLDTFLVTRGSHLIEFGDNMEINLTQENFLIHPSPSIVMHSAGLQAGGAILILITFNCGQLKDGITLNLI